MTAIDMLYAWQRILMAAPRSVTRDRRLVLHRMRYFGKEEGKQS